MVGDSQSGTQNHRPVLFSNGSVQDLRRTKRLLDQVRSYCKDNAVLQKTLANQLGLSPTAMNEIFQERNNPSCEVGLHMLSILESQTMKTLIDAPQPPRASTRDPSEPKTLQQAKEMLEALRSQLAQAKAAAVASPAKPGATAPTATAKPKLASSGADSLATPGADRLGPTPMPITVPAIKKAALSESAVSPVLCQRELDIADFDTLLSMLSNPIHDQMQQSCIYAEVKKRRALVGNRFQ